MTTNVDLRMSFDNVYQPVLTIPVEECQYIPSLGCVISGLQYMALKAISPSHLVAQQLSIMNKISLPDGSVLQNHLLLDIQNNAKWLDP